MSSLTNLQLQKKIALYTALRSKLLSQISLSIKSGVPVSDIEEDVELAATYHDLRQLYVGLLQVNEEREI